ncbi:hypothetical protein A3A54_01095 [Candidatus Curtissbacteria bacterium RIFCSPLOWO2_01_FULL_39_62]|uniref:Phospholipid/glycerol acyltransferase domain-containing protein n=2 Tax=Candidatus Curtissiibacteriota TaxID=1752717 RepID=A0A1F5GAN6_9BACT|nr:MAG: hypothetical protein A2775_01705 [Candidatus Curtissbacteria bacterium RIFCSPHIGHO2_01_FULL_39_57]OGD88895.1 MAG: hypothetical protein A3D04_03795 [Candidatus Curtissbacteria bacterium RIFCSPHIGHO2_02_FULL_40_16b]OGD91047.1 MAG: hypothetical protein A3E11_00225 [Candidatus Curtissbacteria bacterium RIFCSPHIGHO2_12_FULL_38_37]OGD99381.1 MAG: hypothetical protein A3J17_02425 [Candidatus Curtissbacteria bacterium RIFCSPLOWO2_02_FULL_40_11]OGE01411.1 MAG: hypothetical protein A3A54_01095 [C
MSERLHPKSPAFQRDTESPQSDIELYRAICRSAEFGEKRNPLADMQTLLELKRLELSPNPSLVSVDSGPIIFVPNHFGRNLAARDYYLPTTEESFISVAATTLSVANLFQIDEKVSWVLKKLPPNRLEYRKTRQTQNATISCYGYIGIEEGKSYNTMKEIVKRIKSGKHIGMFAQLKPHHELRHINPRFPQMLEIIQRGIECVQIMPVSIYIEGNIINVMLSKPVVMSKQDDALVLTERIMRIVAKGLPDNLQGAYGSPSG